MTTPLQPPKTLFPLIDKHRNDCSRLRICSLHCPQLCFKAIFPNHHPSPPSLPDHHQFSTTNFSPLVIAIICILAAALLLLSYYTLISKYCARHGAQDPNTRANRGTRRRRRLNNLTHHRHVDDDVDDDDEEIDAASGDIMTFSSLHEPWQWHVSLTTGLDEAQIKSITVCKYSKEDGLLMAGGGDQATEHLCCCVCLSEFRDGESLRLLPKCSHAFHLHCIDTWLRTHSTCPLCRANIFFFGTETADDGMERVELVVEGAEQSVNVHHHDTRGNDERDGGEQLVRRCVSMDHLCGQMGNSGGYECSASREEGRKDDVWSRNSSSNSNNSSSSSRRVVDTVKRSLSSGRLFYLTRHGSRPPCILHPATSTSTSNA